MNSAFLLSFLLVNVFLIGVLVAIGVQHAVAHFRPAHIEEPHHRMPRHAVQLPPASKERLLATAEANFQHVLDRSAAELEHEQKAIISQLNKQFEKIGSQVVLHEMARYQTALEQLRAHAETTLGDAQANVAKHQAELTTKMAKQQAAMEADFEKRKTDLETQLHAELATEKQRMSELMDSKLADAVTSFLLETLGHNVDLGAQSNYLTAMLDQHKAELTKGVTDEA